MSEVCRKSSSQPERASEGERWRTHDVAVSREALVKWVI